jgi:protein-S-isoprenylcysteine O-methyltransferase Ste14
LPGFLGSVVPCDNRFLSRDPNATSDARRHLGRNWSGEITIKVKHELIRSGPFQLLRHPIYTGISAMYAGLALVSGEWLAIAGLAMAAFAYWRKIRLEEAVLVEAFGTDYDAYRRTTWALVPGLF